MICEICFNNPKSFFFRPCGHLFCNVCADRVVPWHGNGQDAPANLRCFLCRGIVEEDLHRFRTIKQVFREFKSALPSSAAYERLFNRAGLIFVSKRSNLSDGNFKKLIYCIVFFLQNGMSNRKWQDSPSKTSSKL
ncbi:Uncharacterized protein APZ42_012585 [Daphnia magna]|uniref:RING-type domain-containing protein n=1 Tax=Daphnia magna TaxID=35525 RepID=A0A162RN82_9CRUS|nr:Uncharacterized protein APZ42_012585 [Daphnia magna]